MVNKIVDLHSHTTFSDGNLTPKELLLLAHQKHLSAIAVTDHDTIGGVQLAIDAGNDLGVEVIPGVEISATNHNGTTHILGYFIDIHDQTLCQHLQNYIDSRNDRNPKIIERLNQLGVPLCMEDVHEVTSGKVINRPHIAQAIVNRGFVTSKKEAFDRYLDKRTPAYVPKKTYSPQEVISMIHEAGGLAVIAHPQQLGGSTIEETLTMVQQLVGFGIDGIEAYHSECPPPWCHELAAFAKNVGLLITGGSDFHGDEKHGDLGDIGGIESLDYEIIDQMKTRLSTKV